MSTNNFYLEKAYHLEDIFILWHNTELQRGVTEMEHNTVRRQEADKKL